MGESGFDWIAFHRGELQRSLHGPAWHGPALLETLSDVTVAEAAARPLGGMHSIAELTAHALAWIEEVTRRLRVNSPSTPERGDWPDISIHDEASWRRLLAELEAAGASLDREVAAFPAGRLTEKVGGETFDLATGSGITYAVTLQGLAQHNAYHGGQISLLKHALRRLSPP